MRPGPAPILAALLPTLLLPTLLLLAAPAEARRQAAPPAGRPHHRAASDTDLTLARMAARDRPLWRVWQRPRPLARMLPPSARERVAAPPLTGWGYGGTVPDAAPGF
ncbi:hypothetical protein ABID82_006440 [Methylobacterium sp. PvP062]|jgi:hypothetical protein|uniref:Uncharacterized protein n=2 Tax=Methylobacterium radiotolerans TaxID=31998 RepID=B1M5F3_METRJ|nr:MULTISPECIES: hypothetical protein [Methylobacterium]MCX7330950.1 hypothetical protein [Hyphomicrobiales bacterium]GAN50495.1 hypothetical protein ME121_4541 [Methylobacterium sp. ME121]ACB23544.1 hypothetical protein Mrad2831_1549 [Methylobacterium radiotolerans JCM 2831]KIU36243.1 hypothetical protein SR39_08195 [Methylobacterium radiotolerans]KTS08152.1 hypothetical protein SB3_15710 [Methylobacterium radiotolerans]